MPDKLLENTVTIQNAQVDTGMAVPPSVDVTVSADPSEEYIQATPFGFQATRVLPPWIDELERDFGIDIYDRMMDEPTINSQVGILVSATLGHNIDLSPIRDDKDPEYEDAVRMRDFVQENIDRMEDTDFLPYLYTMSEGGFAHGHQCSEAVFESAQSYTVKTGGPYLMWQRLKPKAQVSTSFLVDSHDNIVGYVHNQRGYSSVSSMEGLGMFDPFPVMDLEAPNPENVLPPSKVPTFTYMMNKSDPRGKAGLRPTYHPWWFLQEAYDNARKFMRQFGVPPIWTTLPATAQDQMIDPVTKQPLAVPKSASAVQNSEAAKLRSSGVGTFGYGASVNTLEPSNSGEFIYNQILLQMRRISMSITFQELATSDPGGSSRALGSIHQDMFAIRTAFLRFRMATFFRNRLCIPLIDLNFGPKYRHLAPKISFGSVELNDLPSVGIMVARLFAAGVIRIDQLPEIFEILNLPPSEMLKSQINLALTQIDSGQLLDAQGMPVITVAQGQLQGSGGGGGGANNRGTAGGSAGSREDMTRDFGMPGNTN